MDPLKVVSKIGLAAINDVQITIFLIHAILIQQEKKTKKRNNFSHCTCIAFRLMSTNMNLYFCKPAIFTVSCESIFLFLPSTLVV